MAEYVTATGIVIADTADILAEVETEFKTALGQDLITTSDTPQGKLIASEVSARTQVAQDAALIANQINPNLSGGIYLDALCALLGTARPASSYTYVAGVTMTGQPNAPIAAGALATGQSTGTLFQLTTAITFDVDGNATGDFQALTAGPIACPAGDLKITTAVLGWETINNATAGVPGTLQANDVVLRKLRNQQLALQSVGTPGSVQANLSATSGVTSFTFRENLSSSSQVISGITMVPKSIYACVDGGTDSDVAMALLKSKDGGCAWNGATSINVTDPISGQVYSVQFDRPTAVPLIAQVYVRQGTYTGVLTTDVPNAILAYASGQIDGQPGFTVGTPASPFEIAAAIGAQLTGVFVKQVLLSTVASGPSGYTTDEIEIAINQKATMSYGAITITIVT